MDLKPERKLKEAIHLYGTYYKEANSRINELYLYFQSRGYQITIWGAGLKGMAFLHVCDMKKEHISCVYDVDQKKTGSYMITGHVVEDFRQNKSDIKEAVLLMNGIYEAEVVGLLKEHGKDKIVINMDSFIDSGLSIDKFEKIQKTKTQLTEVRNKDIKIASMVILYNFGQQEVENIESYYQDSERLYVYDNSTKKDDSIIGKLCQKEKIIYLSGNGNQGIAKAINAVLERAIQDGFQWLITFDQDSIADEQMLKQMKLFIAKYPYPQKLGWVVPNVMKPGMAFGVQEGTFSYCRWVQQSGALHNLDACSVIGNYDENLFIDQVDYEYCVRLLGKGYQIIKVNDAILYHNTEDTGVIFKRKNGHPLYINKYSPLRYYYNTRNILYCTAKYKVENAFYYESQRRNLKSLLMTLPYEKERLKKIRAVIAGWLDYKLKKLERTNRSFE